MKILIKEYTKQLWQIDWNECMQNKLHSISEFVSKNHIAVLKRRDEVVITRCRIGHSQATHSYLLKREDAPECVFCQCPYTIKHLLLECGDTAFIRYNYFNVQTMKELFTSVDLNKVLSFLKEIGLYEKL